MQDKPAAAERPWHAETAEAALERCRASAQGLTSAEAAQRLEANGPNRLPAGKRRSLAARLFAQVNNLLIYVLLASALIAFLLGHGVDTVVILGVVVINATIGFIQEGRAEKALDAIRGMLTRETSVLRDGRRLTVPVESLVVGDVVLTEAGDRIPADLRLLRASSLRIEEAVLTGESAPADKATEPVAADAPLGDRASIAYSGTLVAGGQGAGLVVATGAATELGRISAMVGGVESLTTPLLRQMDAFARRLTIVILAVAAVRLRFRGAGSRLRDRACVHGRGWRRGRRHSRGPAGGDDDHARDRRPPDGRAQRHHPTPSRRRDARRGVDDLLRQDRHADLEPDDRRSGRDRLGRVRRDRGRL